jgi:hypothetical protein
MASLRPESKGCLDIRPLGVGVSSGEALCLLALLGHQSSSTPKSQAACGEQLARGVCAKLSSCLTRVRPGNGWALVCS